MSAPVQPFEYEVLARGRSEATRCIGCWTYESELFVNIQPRSAGYLYCCRSCLRRLRATLKEAEKELPKLPKRVRPE